MSLSQLLPVTLIVIDLAAAIVYGILDHDFRRVVYWTSAAILTASVTF